MRRSRRCGGDRCAGDRGATILELALVMPLLLLLGLGTAELGLGWIANDHVEGATAQAARVASVSGSRAEADRDVLVSIAAALPPADLSTLDRVVVFKPGAGGVVPTGCIKLQGDVTDTGVAAGCNSYSGATVRAVTATSMTGFGGGVTAKDRYWAPAVRNDALADPPDFIGVWVRTTHLSNLGGFFPQLTITKVSIFQIQPDLLG